MLEFAKVFDFQLDRDDYGALDANFAQSRNLLQAIGDVETNIADKHKSRSS
ncbi:MAG: hypothetical protein J7647_15845 [Cyanobacteria bacterium SBLK]|nr:hypothetical protein [Cyanobacteria bacterium SBLK]